MIKIDELSLSAIRGFHPKDNIREKLNEVIRKVNRLEKEKENLEKQIFNLKSKKND